MAKKTEMQEYDLEKLRDEFPAHELKWRPLTGGINASGKPWLQVSCYAGRESYENRLDDVFGPLNWYADYILLGDGRVICHLYIRYGNEWIRKYGPGEESNVDQGKFMSGHTGSFKKACSCGLGIGRYIGEEEVYFAECSINFNKEFPNKFSQKKNGKDVQFWWKYPNRLKKNEYTIQGPEDSEPQTKQATQTAQRQPQQSTPAAKQNFGPEWIFTFGDYKGTALKDVPVHDLLGYLGSERIYPNLKVAIRFFLKSKGIATDNHNEEHK